jgi:hypothetical protein
VLDLRRADRAVAREFALDLDLALAEAALAKAEDEAQNRLPSGRR